MAASISRAAGDAARLAPSRPSAAGPSLPLERGTIIGFESREPRVRKLGPQQGDEVESRRAPANPEELPHQALGPIAANRASYPARCDDPQPAAVEAVGKREQGQVAAPDADALPLNTEELPAAPDPVGPGQRAIHGSRRRGRPPDGACARSLTTPTGACAPSRGGAARSPGPPSCSSACGTRAFACAAGCSADTCASCPRHLRGPPAGPAVRETINHRPSTLASQRLREPARTPCARRFPVVPIGEVWYIPRPRQSGAPLPAKLSTGCG